MFRLGFVSNSSSCSFVCPVCDNSQFGWDWDEDPVCDKCGVHINNVKTFAEFLIKKYGVNYPRPKVRGLDVLSDIRMGG